MDGNETLFGTVCGNIHQIVHKFTLECHNYVRKTAELSTQLYISSATSQTSVLGLILDRSTDFKTELSLSGHVVDVSRGGENGFIQAIKLSAQILANVKLAHETRLIGNYFKEIEQDTAKYVSGVKDTLKALEIGAVKTLIVWENLDISRYILKNSVTGETLIHHLSKAEENDQSNFRDVTNNAKLKVLDKQSLLGWFATEYKQFGCDIEYVTDKSQEGSQFCRGYGGVGGLLRYQLDMRKFDELYEQ
ncbi:hypothetical protein MKX01_035528 [Papaver californicum]|nr:hypothetical protein MKX01_035528 [Papaver californicum]